MGIKYHQPFSDVRENRTVFPMRGVEKICNEQKVDKRKHHEDNDRRLDGHKSRKYITDKLDIKKCIEYDQKSDHHDNKKRNDANMFLVDRLHRVSILAPLSFCKTNLT